MAYLPLRCCITTEVLGVVWSFAWPKGDPYILALRFPRQTIHPDYFSFPCFIGLDFFSFCKESDLRVNGSFHG
jgi:hypothetical protein